MKLARPGDAFDQGGIAASVRSRDGRVRRGPMPAVS